jgi:hypothetical protein
MISVHRVSQIHLLSDGSAWRGALLTYDGKRVLFAGPSLPSILDSISGKIDFYADPDPEPLPEEFPKAAAIAQGVMFAEWEHKT